MNRRGFVGTLLAVVGGFFFPRKTVEALPVVDIVPDVDFDPEQLLQSIYDTARWACSKYHDTYSGTGYIAYACPKLILLIKEADDKGICSAAITERVIRGTIFAAHSNEQRHQNGTQHWHERPVDFDDKRPFRWKSHIGPTSLLLSHREPVKHRLA